MGPGNVSNQNFERSMSEAPVFNPEILPTPDQKEEDPGRGSESVGDNLNTNNGVYIDSSLLGSSTVNATTFDTKKPELGEVVDEGAVGMKGLSDEQVIGTDINVSKFHKNGVSRELAARLDELKNEPNLYKQSVGFMMEAKKSLSSSFDDRRYLMEEKK